MKYGFLLILTAMIYCPHAKSFIGFGVDSIAIANQYMMADPPIPKVLENSGDFRVEVKPAYFTAQLDDANADGSFAETGEFSGFGLALNVNYGLRKNLSAYFWMVADRLTGDFSGATTAGSTVAKATGVTASFYNIGIGASYQVYQGTASLQSITVFAGPFVPIYDFSQSYSESNAGTSVGDFDMSSTEIFFGFFIGIQAEFMVKENWLLSPYIAFADTFGDKCRTYSVDTIRSSDTTVNLDQTSTLDCGGNTNTDRSNSTPRQMFFDTQIGGLGLNVSYLPWSVTVNVTAPFITPLIIDPFYEDPRPKVSLITFQKTF
ncbi:hypothetical protein COB52_05935 [Candidatus Kaiserbacteria bacterium]|nr:MAG: hypothetical protein COB52_05935 [Candidatus Kaiserbacteria bacterium]